MKPLILTLALLRGADAVTTVDLAHRYGGREANPFMPQNPEAIAALIGVETAIQIYTLVRLEKEHPRLAKIIGWASIGVEAWVVRHNIQQYR